MFLHKRSNGFYHVHFRNESGKWQSVSTRTRYKVEANKFFSNLKESLQRKPAFISFSNCRKKYLVYSDTNHSPQSRVRLGYVLAHFGAFIGDPPLHRITIQDIEAYKTLRLDKVSPVTVNIELRTLKAFFGTAEKWGLIEKNPFKGVNMVRIPEQFPTYFRQDEIKPLLNVIPQRWLKDVVLLALNTGMRRGELVNLKWADIDFSNSVLFVRNTDTFKTKSRMDRIIPLNTQALNLLKERGRNSEYVFTNSQGERIKGKYVSECFREAVENASLNPKLHFHSLRHSFASYLVQSGVPIYEVQKLLGHSNISVTQVYSHLKPEYLHATVNKISVNLN